MIECEGGCRAAAPKGSMTYAFTHMRNFLLLLLLVAGGWPNLAEIGSILQNLAEIDGEDEGGEGEGEGEGGENSPYV